MPGPYDYTIKQPDIAGSLLGGIQAGQELAAQRSAVDQAAQYKTDLQDYLQNPSPQKASEMSVKYPKQREAYKQSWDILSKDQQDQTFSAGTEAYSAIQNGKPAVAIGIVDKQIKAMENSGQDASSLIKIRDSIAQDPKGAGASIALGLSSLEPERWGKIATELRASQAAPAQLEETQSKASKAATDAKFAESKAVQDLAKGGWDIYKIQNDTDIARKNSQIAALNAGVAREKNDLKREELGFKLQEKMAARDLKVNERAAEVSASRATIDNMLNTTERILNTPTDVLESAAGPISSKIPTLSSDTSDLEELVTTLSSQAFMAQIPALKGMGALSNSEGEKLQASLQNLSLRQSPERLTENIREARRLMSKARENLSNRYGVPDNTPDVPAAAQRSYMKYATPGGQ